MTRANVIGTQIFSAPLDEVVDELERCIEYGDREWERHEQGVAWQPHAAKACQHQEARAGEHRGIGHGVGVVPVQSHEHVERHEHQQRFYQYSAGLCGNRDWHFGVHGAQAVSLADKR